MLGIKGFGLHLPAYRLSRSVVDEAWGRPAGRGERTVANFDQDSLTMGTDAALDCLEGEEGKTTGIDGLFFASVSPPYREKLTSSLMALALDLPQRMRTTDHIGSLRSSTAAMLGAMDAIQSRSCQNVLVAAADCRPAEPGSALECGLGDGAVCLLMGSEDVVGDIVASVSISDEFIDLWRREEDPYVRQDDVRFCQEYGYMRLVGRAVEEVLHKTGVGPGDVSRLVLPVVDARSHIKLAKKLGFDPGTQTRDAITPATGILGSAHSLVLLCAALEKAEPGALILFATYGDGSDAMMVRVTDHVSKLKKKVSIHKHLEHSNPLNNYNKYLCFRQVIKGQAPSTEPFSSISMSYRERDHNIRLYARTCRQCGLVQFLKDIHVCPECNAREDFEPTKLSKRGTLFSFNHEYYYPSPDPPTTMAIVDFPEGARITLQMTDTPTEHVHIGMPVEMTLRKYHDGNFFHNYFWKCRA